MTAPSNSGRYHIGTVSKLTGISSHNIRIWERRYKAVEPERSAGGTREYSDEHVDKLLLLRTLNESGHAIGQIAHLDTATLRGILASARRRGLVAEPQAVGEAALATEILTSITELDMPAAERMLVEASSVLSPLTMVFDLIAPLVQAIGDRWQAGEIRIASEHAATALFRTILGSFLSKQVVRDNAPRAVAATISGELHELGALMVSFVAVSRGWRVAYMGPNMPVHEIVHVVEQSSARLLLLSTVNQRSEESVALLSDLRAALPATVNLLVGGRASSEYSDIFDVSERGGDLRDLHERLGTMVPVLSRGPGLAR